MRSSLRMHQPGVRKMPRGSRLVSRVLFVGLREESLFGRLLVEVGMESAPRRGKGGQRRLRTRTYIGTLVLPEGRIHFSHAGVAVRSQFWYRTADRPPMPRPHFCVETFAQHQPAGTAMQSRSRVFGLWTNGNEVRARAALSSAPSVKGVDAGH